MLDTETRLPIQAAFRSDVLRGLSGARKTLPARWLYDAHGSALFETITGLPEYYLTRTETAILTTSTREIAQFIGPGAVLVEYGAGAALKTEILLRAVEPTSYVPIDIAADFLAASAARIHRRFPHLDIVPLVADFTANFELPEDLPPGRKVGFFPGSTIGNLASYEARDFLQRMAAHVGPGGAGLIGVDLKKDLETLLAAYDDRDGVTARFNLNLLARINRELGGEFDIGAFEHQARWNAIDSAVEMHAVSTRAQTIKVAGQSFAFETGESIHTESSRKYDLQQFADLATASGWRLGPVWTDSEDRFAVVALIATGS